MEDATEDTEDEQKQFIVNFVRATGTVSLFWNEILQK